MVFFIYLSLNKLPYSNIKIVNKKVFIGDSDQIEFLENNL